MRRKRAANEPQKRRKCAAKAPQMRRKSAAKMNYRKCLYIISFILLFKNWLEMRRKSAANAPPKHYKI